MQTFLLSSSDYRHLRNIISRQIEEGAGRMKIFYQEELLRTYWTIGRIIYDTINFAHTPSSRNAEIIFRLLKDFNPKIAIEPIAPAALLR